ncbi:MAG TPA: hypothetical protein VFA22_03050 [Stellaceae bacterium]|nr:hypothetical protein [Stellaceae bacterium]
MKAIVTHAFHSLAAAERAAQRIRAAGKLQVSVVATRGGYAVAMSL